MDSLGKDLSNEYCEEQKLLVLRNLNEFDPDIVILFDDLSCKLMIPLLVNTKYKVVFGGMNLPPENYDEKFKFMNSRQKPGFNITGVTEEVDYTKALMVLKEIIPDKKNMVIVSSSGMDFISDVLENFKNKMKNENQKFPFKLIDTIYVNNFNEFKDQIIRLQKDDNVDVIFVFTLMALKDESGKVVSVKDGIKWVVKNQLKPGLSWLNSWIELGHLCGACVDLQECGVQMGKIVERVLNGENPGDISIENPDNHFIALNLERARILNLKIPFHVFEGAQIVYEKAGALY